jgi:hypothetical protein
MSRPTRRASQGVRAAIGREREEPETLGLEAGGPDPDGCEGGLVRKGDATGGLDRREDGGSTVEESENPGAELASPAEQKPAAMAKSKLVWTEEEDNIMREMVEKHGEGRWSLMAKALKTKNAKQCRRRWKNHLAIHVKQCDWNFEEDERLIEYHRRMGNKWTAISKEFGDRTDNACKNRWHALSKRRPELLDLKVPLSTVGVRKGTKTHSLILEDSMSVGSDPSIGIQSKLAARARLPATPFDQQVPGAGGGYPAMHANVQDYIATLLQGNGSMLGSQQISSLPNPSALAGVGTNINALNTFGTMDPSMQAMIHTMMTQKMTGLPQVGSDTNALQSVDFSDSFQKHIGSLFYPGDGGGINNAMLQHLLSFKPGDVLAPRKSEGEPLKKEEAAAAAEGSLENKSAPEMATLDSNQFFDQPMTFPSGKESLDVDQKRIVENLLSDNETGAKRKRPKGDTGEPGAPSMAGTQSDFYRQWGKTAKVAAEAEEEKKKKTTEKDAS